MMEAGDNVATVVVQIDGGEEIIVETDKQKFVVHVMENIPFGHKFAIRDISKGDLIIKYGEPIGAARTDIKTGQHVHVHNLESRRGRGDR